MNYVDAIILGIIEGLTEFIPVSSTGHLIIVNELLNLHGEHAATFDIVIQLGAILAVVLLYRDRFLGLLDFKANAQLGTFKGVRGLGLLAVAAFPALGVGALFGSQIKAQLFNSTSVALALIVGGIALMIFDREKSRAVTTLEQMTVKQALGVGLMQILSLWPGFSRAGATILGGLCVGMSRALAAEFSFLLAVPVLSAACGYELLKSWSSLTPDALVLLAIGFAVSFVVAIVAIKFFITIVKTYSLRPFALYRIVLGLAVLLWM